MSDVMPQVCPFPTLTAVQLAAPATGTGHVIWVVLSLPSWPLALSPQHLRGGRRPMMARHQAVP